MSETQLPHGKEVFQKSKSDHRREQSENEGRERAKERETIFINKNNC